MHAGMPPVGLIGEIYGLGKAFLGGDVSAESAEKAVEIAGEVKKTATGLLDPKIEPVTEKVIHGPISFNLSYCRPILIVRVVIYAEGSDALDHAQLFKHLQRQILRKIRRKTSSVGSFVGMLFRNRA